MKKLTLLALALVAGRASASTLFVDAASAGGDGSAAAPFAGIQEAIQAAQPGDLVSVAPGVYYGALQLRAGVKVASQKGAASTIIDGLGANPAVSTDSTVLAGRSTLQGFTVRNGAWLFSCNAAWPYSWADIDECVFQDATWGAIGTGGNCGLNVMRTVIRNVPTGIYPFLNAMNVATWNVTFDSVGTAFYSYKAYLQVRNTTITNASIAFGLFGYTGWNYVSGDHNNVWNVPTLAGLNMGGTMRPDLSQLAPPTSADPMFANRAAGDLRLTAGSALVDAGLPVTLGWLATTLPFFGEAPDVGAFELTEIPLPEQVAALAESYATISADAFRNAAEQRAMAFQNKLLAVQNELVQIDPSLPASEQVILFTNVRNKLANDLLAKADGFHGGNPKNDWIVQQEAQDVLVPELKELIAAVQARIDELSATAAP
jgi:hypothetical protein